LARLRRWLAAWLARVSGLDHRALSLWALAQALMLTPGGGEQKR
jgi:hypothetical protein